MNEQNFDCHFCGGKVTAQRVDVMRHWKDRYILIENVPAHVCTQCGERYYDAVVAEAMDQIMKASETELGAKREICVPVIEMPALYPSPQQVGAAVHDEPAD
ncbi:MAG TPA: type II toxin-antitoxin system MqsA family antitoxin [Anaerolineae bacterium]|nr:type II toxin-antitoxin system MqsA family antitoxin [Anaerolineae bacterium]